jgi:hypothetical protein
METENKPLLGPIKTGSSLNSKISSACQSPVEVGDECYCVRMIVGYELWWNGEVVDTCASSSSGKGLTSQK